MQKKILLKFKDHKDCFGQLVLDFSELADLPSVDASFSKLSEKEKAEIFEDGELKILEIENDPEAALLDKLERLKKKQKQQIESIEQDLARVNSFVDDLAAQSTEVLKLVKGFAGSKNTAAYEKLKIAIQEKKDAALEELGERIQSFNTHFWGVHEGYLAVFSRALASNEQLLGELSQSCARIEKFSAESKNPICPFYQRSAYALDLLRKFTNLPPDGQHHKQVLTAFIDSFGVNEEDMAGFLRNIKFVK